MDRCYWSQLRLFTRLLKIVMGTAIRVQPTSGDPFPSDAALPERARMFARAGDQLRRCFFWRRHQRES